MFGKKCVLAVDEQGKLIEIVVYVSTQASETPSAEV